MKREIKFRGRRLDNGRWVYGSLIQNINDKGVIVSFIVPSLPFMATPQGAWTAMMYPVDTSTVGQYMMLKDKNGKKIYEGDIFIELERLQGDDIPREVTFENGAFRCAYTKKHWAKGYNNVPFNFLYDLKDGNIEVVGNIHDQNFKHNDNK